MAEGELKQGPVAEGWRPASQGSGGGQAGRQRQWRQRCAGPPCGASNSFTSYKATHLLGEAARALQEEEEHKGAAGPRALPHALQPSRSVCRVQCKCGGAAGERGGGRGMPPLSRLGGSGS